MRLGLAIGCVLFAAAGCKSSPRPVPDSIPPAPAMTRLVAAAALAPCPPVSATPTADGATASQSVTLPSVTLRCLGSGPSVRLAGVRGPALVNLWAAWCLPCQAEMPTLQALHAKAGRRLLVLGVVTDDTAGNALGQAARAGVHYSSVLDTGGAVRRRLGYPGPPVTLFIDRNGRIVHRIVGAAPALTGLESLLAQHLGVRL